MLAVASEATAAVLVSTVRPFSPRVSMCDAGRVGIHSRPSERGWCGRASAASPNVDRGEGGGGDEGGGKGSGRSHASMEQHGGGAARARPSGDCHSRPAALTAASIPSPSIRTAYAATALRCFAVRTPSASAMPPSSVAGTARSLGERASTPRHWVIDRGNPLPRAPSGAWQR